MATLNVFHYMGDLKNLNEKRVWAMLADFLDHNDTSRMCLCAICLVDIAAITLNNIPAHYQTEEHLAVAAERVPDAEIYKQLKKAVELVTKRPHH